MLVAVGPPCDLNPEQYSLVSSITGLVAYDLRTRLRPDGWGVVRAVGDVRAAARLAEELRSVGMSTVVATGTDSGDDYDRFGHRFGTKV